MPFTIEIDDSAVDAALARLDGALRPAALQRATLKAGFFLEGKAKLRAAVDTGFMRNSIQTIPGGGGARVVVGASYGVHVEWGTRRMRAQPFIRPTVEQDGSEAARIVLDEIRREAGL